MVLVLCLQYVADSAYGIGDFCSEYCEDDGSCTGDCSSCGDNNEEDGCGLCPGTPGYGCNPNVLSSTPGEISNQPSECQTCGCSDLPDNACDCMGNVLDCCGVCGGEGDTCNGECTQCYGEPCPVIGGTVSQSCDAGTYNSQLEPECANNNNGTDSGLCLTCHNQLVLYDDDGDFTHDTFDPCVGELDDCGVCNGGNLDMDNCGVCDGGNADDLGCGCFEPGPSGCDNTCGSTLVFDECGICGGGNADMDACGVCGGNNEDDLGCGCFEPGPSGCDNTCGSTLVLDCNNNCGGSAVVDECGICGGSGIPWDECDCLGNVLDECNVCGGNNNCFNNRCHQLDEQACLNNSTCWNWFDNNNPSNRVCVGGGAGHFDGNCNQFWLESNWPEPNEIGMQNVTGNWDGCWGIPPSPYAIKGFEDPSPSPSPSPEGGFCGSPDGNCSWCYDYLGESSCTGTNGCASGWEGCWFYPSPGGGDNNCHSDNTYEHEQTRWCPDDYAEGGVIPNNRQQRISNIKNTQLRKTGGSTQPCPIGYSIAADGSCILN